MIQELGDSLRNLILDRKFIVSASGGVDSQVLLFLCLMNFDAKQFEVVYFDHGCRKDTYCDINVINSLLWGVGKSLHVVQVDLDSDFALRSRRSQTDFWKVNSFGADSGFQALASNFRHNYLVDLAAKFDADLVLTAHHLDDQIESLFEKLYHKASYMGFCLWGRLTQFDDIVFVKPLLNCRKSEIYKCAQNFRVPYYSDSSNKTTVYNRNKIRHLWRAKYDLKLLEESMIAQAVFNSSLNLSVSQMILPKLKFVDGILNFELNFLKNLSSDALLYVFKNIFSKLSADVFTEFERFLFESSSSSVFEFNGVRCFKTRNQLYACLQNEIELARCFFGSVDLILADLPVAAVLCCDGEIVHYKKFFRKLGVPVFLRSCVPVSKCTCECFDGSHYKLYSKSLIGSVYKNFVDLA